MHPDHSYRTTNRVLLSSSECDRVEGFEERPVSTMVAAEGTPRRGKLLGRNSPDARVESTNLGTGAGGGAALATTALWQEHKSRPPVAVIAKLCR